MRKEPAKLTKEAHPRKELLFADTYSLIQHSQNTRHEQKRIRCLCKLLTCRRDIGSVESVLGQKKVSYQGSFFPKKSKLRRI